MASLIASGGHSGGGWLRFLQFREAGSFAAGFFAPAEFLQNAR
jgi:hypothetical protein